MGLRVVMPLGMAIVKVPPWLAEPLVVLPLDPPPHAVIVMPASTDTAASPVAFRLRDIVGLPQDLQVMSVVAAIAGPAELRSAIAPTAATNGPDDWISAP